MDYQSKYSKYKSKYQKLLIKLNQKMNKLKQSQSLSPEETDDDIEYEQIDQVQEVQEVQEIEEEVKDPIFDLIQNLLENNPIVYIFITGKYASGKSTTTNQIKEKFKSWGVFTIELDEVIRDYVLDKTNPDQAISSSNAFKVYKGMGSTLELENFVQGTKSKIESGIQLENKLIILEGALSSQDLCKQILGSNPLLVIYFQPTDHSIHKKRIVSRMRTDIVDNTYTLPDYWGSNGIFNREEVVVDIESGIDLETKYSDRLDSIVSNVVLEAEKRAEIIRTNFTTENWYVMVKYT